MLRVGTFNLENLDDEAVDEAAFVYRLKLLRPQILRMRADVLCLQEVNSQKLSSSERSLRALTTLLQDTPYSEYNRSSTLHAHGGAATDKHNLVTLSRFTIQEESSYRHELVKPPLYKMMTADPPAETLEPVEWDRPFLYTAVQLSEKQILHVFNLHLRAPLAAFVPGQKLKSFMWKTVSGWAEGYYMATMKRAGQALEARLLIDQIFDKDPKALVLVCGDFNAEEYEVPTRILKGGEEDTGNGDLTHRMLIPVERSLPADRRFSVIHHGRPQMLDHVLVSRSLLGYYQFTEIHNESLADEQVAYHSIRNPPDSYHAPVVATFDINGIWEK